MRYAALLLLCWGPVFSQTPSLLNARLETRAVSNLEADFEALVKGEGNPCVDRIFRS